MGNKLYFEDISVDVSNLKTIEEVLKHSKLDYTVESQNIYLKNGDIIPNKFANVRTDNNLVLGIVGKNYNIVQNIDSFKFINELIGSGFEFASAGAFDDGIGAFILLKYESFYIANNQFIPYLLITNNFDGSGTVKIEFTPIRKDCKSVLLLTDKSVDNKISIKHCTQKQESINVSSIIGALNKYIKFLKKCIEDLNNIKLKDCDFNNILNELIPIDDKMSNIIKLRTETTRNEIKSIFDTLDIDNTAYKLILSIADYESHRAPIRNTKNDYIYIDRVIDNMWLTNDAYRIIKKRLMK